MILKERAKGFVSGCIAAALCFSIVFAEPVTKAIDVVYKDIKVFVDGTQIDPRNVSGEKVEPFTYNDTTYLPARAIAQALGKTVEWDEETSSVYIGKKPVQEVKEVTVENASEFVKALGSNTRILLKPGTYNLSSVSDTYIDSSEVCWEKVFDGNQLTLDGVENLSIEGLGDKPVDIAVEPRYANIFNFVNSSNISIKNIRAGHTPDKGTCIGGVFKFTNSNKIDISGSELYGCGAIGLTLNNVDTLSFADSIITECTSSLMDIANSKNISFDRSKFTKTDGYMLISILQSSDIIFNESEISENNTVHANLNSPIFSVTLSTNVVMKDSKILNNTAQALEASKNSVKLENTIVEGNTFTAE